MSNEPRTPKAASPQKLEKSIHATFPVEIGTSILPQRILDNTPTKNQNDKKCKCKCNCPLPIFLPYGRFMFFWDSFLLIILIYSIVEIPYTLAFIPHSSPSSIVVIIGLFVDLYLLVDIIIAFRTAYIDKYDRLRIIHDPKLIAIRYLKTWFIIDFLAATPFTYLIILVSDNYTSKPIILYLFRLLRIVKLIRIIKILKMFRGFTEKMVNIPANSIMRTRNFRTLMQLLQIIALMLLTAHYFACFWYGIGVYADDKGLNSWVDIIEENGDQNKGNFVKYSYSFYWAIVTLFTTGYGDIHADNIYEHWTCSIGILIGSIFFAYFISVLTSGLTDDLQHQSISQRLEQSLYFCAHYDLPTEIRRAVLTHIRYYNSYNYLFDPKITLNALPNHLQKSIAKYIATNILKELDIFESLPTAVVGEIALKLKSKSVGENQFLYSRGDIGKELFIQRTGKSRLLYNGVADKLHVRSLKRGDVVGEDAILCRTRQHTVVCAIWSEFYVLDITDIVDVLKTNFDLATAKKEWYKIKNVIKTTKSSSLLSEISEITDVNDISPQHRHVRFQTVEMKDFPTFVDPALRESASTSYIVNNNNDCRDNMTYSQQELALEAEDEEIKKTRKRISFKSVKNMFLDRQSSESRHKKLTSQYHSKKKTKKVAVAYAHVPSDDIIDTDDDYLFGVTHSHHSLQRTNSAGFFGNSSGENEEKDSDNVKQVLRNNFKSDNQIELAPLDKRTLTHRMSRLISPETTASNKKSDENSNGEESPK